MQAVGPGLKDLERALRSSVRSFVFALCATAFDLRNYSPSAAWR